MLRFGIVLLTVVALGTATAVHLYWLALTLGIAVGLLLLLQGMAAGGGMGNARQFEKKPADVSTRIGICLAAAGIAASSLGHDPAFPPSFRVFYMVILVLACLTALTLAGKSMK